MKTFGYTVKQAFIQFGRNFNTAIISIFAIAAMLLILGLFFALIVNISAAAESIKSDYDSIEIFLDDELTQEDAEIIADDLRGRDGVEDVYYKTKKQAMKELKERWGDNGYLLDSLEKNPLPNSVVIVIDDLEQADVLAKQAATYDGVEDVKYYKSTVDKLLSATKLVQWGAVILMIFLIIVSIVVVSNTIKLTVFNRADEISIMKYVGATNWFIRGPFLIEGILIGIISAGIALGVIAAIYRSIIAAIGDQMTSMFSMPMVSMNFMVSNLSIIFLILGVSIGACGSIISMRKFLDA